MYRLDIHNVMKIKSILKLGNLANNRSRKRSKVEYTYLYCSIPIVHTVDIDECLRGLNECTQNCLNGSYQCSCYTGYYLHENGKACLGNLFY